jgi:IS30 family transposase
MSYKHLSLEERYYLETAKKTGKTLTEIAQDMGRSQSTLSRELARNTGQRGYRHKQAMSLARERHALKPKLIKITEPVKDQIDSLISQEWSPEQIAGRLKLKGVVSLHHETIYQYILADKRAGGSLFKYLRHQNKKYLNRYGSPLNRSGIPNRIDIDNRPEVANQRGRIGDWEADTIIGKNHKGAIVTLDERKSKLRVAAALQGKKSRLVTEAMIKLLHPLQAFVKTITFDNGKEFTGHELIAEKLSCKTYFAKPYHSWERGQNENANGLLRQYFPKSMELTDVENGAVIDAVNKLNDRPRKCLKFKTPYEAFEELTGVNVKQSWGYALIT